MNNIYPFLITLKGKHDYHYFHITDNESYLDAHVKIFKINQSNGYYYDLGEEFDHGSWVAEKRQALEKIKSDEILSSQIGSHNINRIERDIGGMEEHQKFQRMYAKCVDGDREAILDFLYGRSSHGYEYEEITEEYYS
jgi:uncharacterized membrane protein